MKDRTYKWLTRFFITLGIVYWAVLIIAATTGCASNPYINLKERISTGGDWIIERKDFK